MSDPHDPPPAEDVVEPGGVFEFVMHPRFARLIAEHRQEASK